MSIGLSLTLYHSFHSKHNVNACGIIGMIAEEEVQSYLMEGLAILQNRGYDSAGIATIHFPNNTNECELRVTKYASRGSTSDSLEILQKEVKNTSFVHKYIQL